MNGGGEDWDQLEGDLEKKVLSDVSDAHALCILYSFSSHSTSGLVNRHTKSKDRSTQNGPERLQRKIGTKKIEFPS